ncbi:MAG: hypothetical protein PHU64_07295 [Candidatus Omnitrophica bacterium]|nr:hypothetical protein [Candidatus Omnitrophota bacterium]MDD5429773.1 hypothetical protein [Candidatus Omnitrophota bacterium]
MNNILRYKNFIFSGVIIFIFVIVLRGTITHYSLLLEDIEQDKVEIEEGKVIIDEWNKTKSEQNALTGSFFQKDALLVKKFVEEKAQISKVDIESLNIESFDKDFYWETTISLATKSSYKDFSGFIKVLNESGITIERIKVNSSDKGIRANTKLKGIVLK